MMDFALPEDHAPMMTMAEEFGAPMPIPTAPAPRPILALPVVTGEAGKSRRSLGWRLPAPSQPSRSFSVDPASTCIETALRAPSAHHFLEGSTEVMRLITARCQIGGN